MNQFLLLICTVAPLTRGYILGPSRGTWNEGEAYCNSIDSHLASIHSQSELEAATLLCQTSSTPDDCHIGMRYVNGLWKWTDDSPTDFGFNNDGSPNSNTPPWENSSGPSNTSHDAANNATCQKIDLSSSNPPGYFDDGECDRNLHPLCNDVEGYVAPEPNLYFMGPTPLTWDAAELYCNSQGSNLASIHSYVDLQAVTNLCKTQDLTDNCHIGMSQDQTNLKWKWNDGSKSDYGFNNDGTPNGEKPPWEGSHAFDANSGHQCQQIDISSSGTSKGFFDDSSCDDEEPPICNGEPCIDNRINDECGADRDCPPCMRCCKGRKICEYRPGFGPGGLISAKTFNEPLLDMNVVGDKNNYNYYGYIILVGVIAFILINNIFIGCWCLKQSENKQYEKVVIDNEV